MLEPTHTLHTRKTQGDVHHFQTRRSEIGQKAAGEAPAPAARQPETSRDGIMDPPQPDERAAGAKPGSANPHWQLLELYAAFEAFSAASEEGETNLAVLYERIAGKAGRPSLYQLPDNMAEYKAELIRLLRSEITLTAPPPAAAVTPSAAARTVTQTAGASAAAALGSPDSVQAAEEESGEETTDEEGAEEDAELGAEVGGRFPKRRRTFNSQYNAYATN